MKLKIMPPERRQRPPCVRKLNVSALSGDDKVQDLQDRLRDTLSQTNTSGDETTYIEQLWKDFKQATLSAATDVLGFVKKEASGLV